MNEVIVNGLKFYTNIIDYEKISKCVHFFSDGCSSYAISFGNNSDAIIQTVNLEGTRVHYLRRMNFDQFFLPELAKNIRDSKEILYKGLDLIEIL